MLIALMSPFFFTLGIVSVYDSRNDSSHHDCSDDTACEEKQCSSRSIMDISHLKVDLVLSVSEDGSHLEAK